MPGLVPIAGNHRLPACPPFLSSSSFTLINPTWSFFSCWVESTHPFAARVVDSRPSVLLHPPGCHTCLTRCRLQMFLKPQVCVEYGNRTREHQSGHQSSYWLWTSLLNFSDLMRTGVTHSPPHPKFWVNQSVGQSK